MKISKTRMTHFQDEMFKWWTNNKRQFPWRETVDPYKILISEFMLQQTQANRVDPKYVEFLSKFPTILTLAEAENRELLATWSGLGYNRRAIWLKEIATQIVSQGYFPTEPNELIKFRGIGAYTSKSIPIFAFNSNLAAVDVNIRRVLVHFEFITIDTKDKEIADVALQLVPENQSKDWHNMLMDFSSANLKKLKLNSKLVEPFKGSNREVRGKIIKLLTTGQSLTIDQIESQVNKNGLAVIIDKLVKEGLIIKFDGAYTL